MTTLHPDFREFLSALVSRNVRFLVVGAHALAAHGQPRYTGDLDVWVDPTPENAGRVADALVDFGFPAYKTARTEFATPDRMTSMGVVPVRIDVMTSISGVQFAGAWKRRCKVTLDRLAVAVLSVEDLRVNKRASGRPKDLLDLALLDELPAVAKKPARKSKAVTPTAKTTPKKKARR